MSGEPARMHGARIVRPAIGACVRRPISRWVCVSTGGDASRDDRDRAERSHEPCEARIVCRREERLVWGLCDMPACDLEKAGHVFQGDGYAPCPSRTALPHGSGWLLPSAPITLRRRESSTLSGRCYGFPLDRLSPGATIGSGPSAPAFITAGR